MKCRDAETITKSTHRCWFLCKQLVSQRRVPLLINKVGETSVWMWAGTNRGGIALLREDLFRNTAASCGRSTKVSSWSSPNPATPSLNMEGRGWGGGGLRYHLPATCSAALRTLPRWLNRLAVRRGGGRGGGGTTPYHTWVSPYQHNKAPLLAGWGKLWDNLQGCFLSFSPQWWVNTWDALSIFFFQVWDFLPCRLTWTGRPHRWLWFRRWTGRSGDREDGSHVLLDHRSITSSLISVSQLFGRRAVLIGSQLPGQFPFFFF